MCPSGAPRLRATRIAGEDRLHNKSTRAFTWRAMFEGAYEEIEVDGNVRKATPCSNAIGKPHSYVDVAMQAKAQVVAEAVTK